MSFQNLQQENGILLMIKIMDNMGEEMKMIKALNLKQKLLNQIFVILLQLIHHHLNINQAS